MLFSDRPVATSGSTIVFRIRAAATFSQVWATNRNRCRKRRPLPQNSTDGHVYCLHCASGHQTDRKNRASSPEPHPRFKIQVIRITAESIHQPAAPFLVAYSAVRAPVNTPLARMTRLEISLPAPWTRMRKTSRAGSTQYGLL